MNRGKVCQEPASGLTSHSQIIATGFIFVINFSPLLAPSSVLSVRAAQCHSNAEWFSRECVAPTVKGWTGLVFDPSMNHLVLGKDTISPVISMA